MSVLLSLSAACTSDYNFETVYSKDRNLPSNKPIDFPFPSTNLFQSCLSITPQYCPYDLENNGASAEPCHEDVLANNDFFLRRGNEIAAEQNLTWEDIQNGSGQFTAAVNLGQNTGIGKILENGELVALRTTDVVFALDDHREDFLARNRTFPTHPYQLGFPHFECLLHIYDATDEGNEINSDFVLLQTFHEANEKSFEGKSNIIIPGNETYPPNSVFINYDSYTSEDHYLFEHTVFLSASAAQSLLDFAQLLFLAGENTEVNDEKIIYFDNGDWYMVK